MLAELVARGQLPPVDERLPYEPGIIPVLADVGNYGGTLRRGFKGVSDRWGPNKLIDHSLVWYDRNLNLRPNLAESWETNKDGSVWIFHLRSGMRWSDGAPFTTADFLWWYEYYLKNPELTPGIASTWTTGPNASLMKLEAQGTRTLVFRFEHPNPMFVYRLSRAVCFMPGHAVARYHRDLTDNLAALEKDMKDRGYENYKNYFDDRTSWYLNPEIPVVGPWKAQNPISDEVFIMERNPYYFATDIAGNQLPYIDHIQHRMFQEVDLLDMWVVNGEIDFQARHIQLNNYTLYKENEKNGDYTVTPGISGSQVGLMPNHTVKDPRVREFFRDLKVRQAMNLAINREEINELIFDGLAVPSQYAPVGLSPQYYAPASKAFIEYDPARAKQLLDEAGYTEYDNEGFRLWKDGSGETISIIIDWVANSGSMNEDTLTLICDYFADVGLKFSYRIIDRSLYEELMDTNDIMVSAWGGDRAILPLVAEAPIWRGILRDRPWAAGWSLWKTNGPGDPNAEEPPQGHWIWTIWDLWDQICLEPDADKQTALFKQILDIWAEQLPAVGILAELPALAIVKNGLKNFAPGFPMDDTTGDESIYNPETLFWDVPEDHQVPNL